MKESQNIKHLLSKNFDGRYVGNALKHYSNAVEKITADDWEGVSLKAGKFVEAVTKALLSFCKQPIVAGRKFSAGKELRKLEGLDAAVYPDTIRIVVPKACLLVYEIASNRGGRHDTTEIDINPIDGQLLIQTISWILAELVRFSSGTNDVLLAANMVDELTNKFFPSFERIDGRSYVNLSNLKPGEVALLLLYECYPRRMSRLELIDQVVRHGGTKNAASVAVQRIKNLVDDHGDSWKLRGLGRQKAEAILREKHHSK